jgi:hypothetical protein
LRDRLRNSPSAGYRSEVGITHHAIVGYIAKKNAAALFRERVLPARPPRYGRERTANYRAKPSNQRKLKTPNAKARFVCTTFKAGLFRLEL